MMSDTYQLGSARPEDLAPAFRLIFRHVPDEEREPRVLNALELIRLKLLDPAGVKVARAADRVVGAVICAPVAGAGGVIWPAQAVDLPEQDDIEDRLMQEAVGWLKSRGAKLAQALLADHERDLGPRLERSGFAHVTDLWYMRHGLKSAEPAPPETLHYETYADCDRAVFQQTLVRTYEDTRDCPEVNGVRNIDEVIAGHRNQGDHDPHLWWLARAGAEPVGVVLLTSMPEWNGWDLIYLGVVKGARGRGVGRELAMRAVAAARAGGARQLTLSVDVRNQPAFHLYRAAGFEAYDQRAVYLRILGNGHGGS